MEQMGGGDELMMTGAIRRKKCDYQTISHRGNEPRNQEPACKHRYNFQFLPSSLRARALQRVQTLGAGFLLGQLQYSC